MKRKNQNKYYRARFVTSIFMLMNIYQIFSSNHISQTYVNKQYMCCIKLLLYQQRNYKHDFICLSETYLDSSIPDNLIEIEGYSLVRADHPDNIKRGGVCIYYKESLPVRIKRLPYFKEALLLEMIHNNKKSLVSVIYRSPSQSYCEFETFLTKSLN